MGTVVGIDAGVGEEEPFDRTAVYQVFLNDFLNVTLVDKTIPNGFGVDDEDWAVLALVQAAGLVNADAVLEASGLYGVFQGSPELFRVFVAAAGASGGVVAFVDADEEVVFKIRHKTLGQEFLTPVGCASARRGRARQGRICENSSLCNWTISQQSKTIWWRLSPGTACAA